MSKQSSKQSTGYAGRNIWMIVLILMIILMISFTLIAPLLSGLSGNDRNIIPLFYTGDREIIGQGGWSYIRVEKIPEMITQDDQVRWEINTNVDLFKTTYANSQGKITVESAHGDKVIAPGTSNSYEFSLNNTGNISLDYTMRMDSVFTLLDHDLPMQVRLRSGDRWIIGSETEWVNSAELDGLIESGTVPVNQYIGYIFEWKWPFEYGDDDAVLLNDLNDTIIGNATVNEEVVFRLSISMESTVTPGAVPMSPGGKDLVEPLILWNILSRGIFPCLLLCLILILLILWRTPVYVTGFLPGIPGKELAFGRKKDILRLNGRFVFKKIYTGKHELKLGEEESTAKIKLKRKRKVCGIIFEQKEDFLVITIGSKIRAIELYLTAAGPVLTVREDNWAAIDKKHNVISPAGIQEPDDEKCNVTDAGLHIDKKGNLDVDIDPAEAK